MKHIQALIFFVFSILVQFTNAQNSIITGKVINSADGTAISGASVVVKGTTSGTITNSEGVYNLEIPQNSQILIFSFLKRHFLTCGRAGGGGHSFL